MLGVYCVFSSHQKLSRSLELEITGVQVLTNVLTTIDEIRDMEIDTDIQLYEIKERIHELNLQSFKVLIY